MNSSDIKKNLGQLLMVGFHGKTIDDPGVQLISKQIEDGKVGGVIFFGYNIQAPDQVFDLTSYLKSLKAPFPLLLAIDEEGGNVQRLSPHKGFPEVWSAEKVSQTFTPEEAYGYYITLAQKLQKFGFNLNFAPSVDLNPVGGDLCPVIGGLGRSYGSAPERVVSFARSFLRAHQFLKVGTCLKHFPGHGRLKTDTHLGLSDATTTWSMEEMEPFRMLLEEATSIMTSHLSHCKWGGDLPITFSKELLTDTLRKEMGFSGVLITDDLHMGAIQENFGEQEAALRALEAGHDLLLFSNNLKACKNLVNFRPSSFLVEDVLGTLSTALDQNIIPYERFEEALKRIEKLKSSFL